MTTQLGLGGKTVPMTHGAFGLGGGKIAHFSSSLPHALEREIIAGIRTIDQIVRPPVVQQAAVISSGEASNPRETRAEIVSAGLCATVRRATFGIGFAEFQPSASADRGMFRIPVVLPMRPCITLFSRASRFRTV